MLGGDIISKFSLDFSIATSKDRLKSIETLDLNKFSPSELETITNYILYGKDEDGTSIVDRKEVTIKTKFNSYQKQKFVSLDELMEDPKFDESILSKNNKIYKKEKPILDKEKIKDIPGMKELWQSIDNMEKQYEQLKQIEKPNKEQQRRKHFLKHYLIQMKTQQYQLMDTVFPTIKGKPEPYPYWVSPAISHLNYPILPCGIVGKQNDEKFVSPHEYKDEMNDYKIYNEIEMEKIRETKKYYFDFTDSKHLIQLIQRYREIEYYISNIPDSPLHNLLWTLDFFIDAANLTELQKLVVEKRKNGLPNAEICRQVNSELNHAHHVSYMSTIFNNSIKKIIAAVELKYSELILRGCNKAWKNCSRCNKIILAVPENFTRRISRVDGLSSRCKKCDKEVKALRKQQKQEKETLLKQEEAAPQKN